jgi:hypothetical protein
LRALGLVEPLGQARHLAAGGFHSGRLLHLERIDVGAQLRDGVLERGFAGLGILRRIEKLANADHAKRTRKHTDAKRQHDGSGERRHMSPRPQAIEQRRRGVEIGRRIGAATLVNRDGGRNLVAAYCARLSRLAVGGFGLPRRQRWRFNVRQVRRRLFVGV